jgi:hypothetical protein
MRQNERVGSDPKLSKKLAVHFGATRRKRDDAGARISRVDDALGEAVERRAAGEFAFRASERDLNHPGLNLLVVTTAWRGGRVVCTLEICFPL